MTDHDHDHEDQSPRATVDSKLEISDVGSLNDWVEEFKRLFGDLPMLKAGHNEITTKLLYSPELAQSEELNLFSDGGELMAAIGAMTVAVGAAVNICLMCHENGVPVPDGISHDLASSSGLLYLLAALAESMAE